MIDAPLVLAFTAGLVATVNPCGFAMLPAYLSYFLGLEERAQVTRSAVSVGRALSIGGVVSAGFLVVFGVAGTLITLGLRSVIGLLPWAAMVVGAGLVVLGAAMVAGYQPVVNLPKPGGKGVSRGSWGMFAFGVSYALASLSCTLPVFLTVVAGAITSAGLLSGVTTFLVYGLGMSLVLVAVTLALAVGRRSMVSALRRTARHLNRAAGVILVASGSYIIYFWAVNLTQGTQAVSDPIGLMERASSRLTELIGGEPLAWGLALGGLVLAALAYSILREGHTK